MFAVFAGDFTRVFFENVVEKFHVCEACFFSDGLNGIARREEQIAGFFHSDFLQVVGKAFARDLLEQLAEIAFAEEGAVSDVVE